VAQGDKIGTIALNRVPMNKKHKRTLGEGERRRFWWSPNSNITEDQQTSYHTTRNSSHIPRSLKDNLGLEVSVVYSIPANAGSLYRQTCQSIETRCKGHDCHLQLYQQDKYTMAEHSTQSGHHGMFQEADILAKTSSDRDQPTKDVREKYSSTCLKRTLN
jgi:hypothetical protein